MILSNELEKQIEAAYDYRGYVMIKFQNGEMAEAFVFNREFSNPRLKEDYFIEVFLKNGEKRRYSIHTIQSIELTGDDCAKGKSY